MDTLLTYVHIKINCCENIYSYLQRADIYVQNGVDISDR